MPHPAAASASVQESANIPTLPRDSSSQRTLSSRAGNTSCTTTSFISPSSRDTSNKHLSQQNLRMVLARVVDPLSCHRIAPFLPKGQLQGKPNRAQSPSVVEQEGSRRSNKQDNSEQKRRDKTNGKHTSVGSLPFLLATMARSFPKKEATTTEEDDDLRDISSSRPTQRTEREAKRGRGEKRKREGAGARNQNQRFIGL